MSLCNICRQISFENLPSLPKYYWNMFIGPGLVISVPHPDPRWPLVDSFGIPYHEDLDSLARASQTCALCSLVHKQVTKFLWTVENGERVGNNGLIHYKTEKPRNYCLRIMKRKSSPDGFVVFTDGTKDNCIWYISVFGFTVPEGSPLAPKIKGRYVDVDPFSPSSLGRAVEWVKRCTQHHTRCTFDVDRGRIPLPRRVLDIGRSSSSNIRLLESEGIYGSYMSLSYVWGSVQPFETKLATYKARIEGIPFQSLPKTIQDAVIITRKMGIQYLWIDALCIIQDDSSDWEREAAKMGDIYANSYLTVSAAAASDSSKGCFIPRSRPESVAFDYTSSDKISGKLVVSPIPIEKDDAPHEYLDMREEPISDRAWTLQERALPTRTLFYASDQMYFECKQEFISEDGLHIEGRYFSTDTRTHHISQDGQGDRSPREHWNTLMTMYGPRKLTKRTDKFPAFSGIAQRFEKILNDKLSLRLATCRSRCAFLVMGSDKRCIAFTSIPSRLLPIRRYPFLRRSDEGFESLW
ncbi:hypothetical protein M422DRAFT_221543 [Sphaerobolus stellatus SS14]|nr:hypothetical protein M422DRAFT_221543 [Sphaerobolus stellatus SS14]